MARRRPSMRRIVLLLGSQQLIGMSRLPAMFHHGGYIVDVWAPPRTMVHYSRFPRHKFAKAWEPTTFADRLRAHLKLHHYDWIVPCDEPTVSALIPHAGSDWLAGRFPTPNRPEVLRVLCSKAEFTATMLTLGLPVPKTIMVESRDEVLDAAESIAYPVIFKPRGGAGGVGVFRADAQADIERQLAAQPDAKGIVQEFLDGQICSAQLLYNHGELIAWSSLTKARTWPGPYGASTARGFVHHPDLVPIFETFGRFAEFHGLCGMDYMACKDGRKLMIEFNPRPSPIFHVARRVGVDFSRSLKSIADGTRDIQGPRPLPPDTPDYLLFPEELTRTVRDETFGHHLLQCLNPRIWADVPWHDLPLARNQARMVFFMTYHRARAAVVEKRQNATIASQNGSEQLSAGALTEEKRG